jgi:DUF4097 and DUF4098 domain-containing protein YvlB
MLPALIVAAALLAQDASGVGPQDQQQQRQIASRTQTDQTVNVQKGMRVELRDCAGEVIVKTWEKDAVRVRAQHSSRTKVEVTPRNQVLQIQQDGRSGVDFDLTVPAWIGLTLEGTECFMDVEGLAGNFTGTTVEGDVVLRGLGGTATIEAIEGNVTIEGGRGRIQVNTTDGDIAVSKASGELLLTSIDGDIRVNDVTASALEISTVDGDIFFGSALQASSRYRFETHDGDLWLALPENSSATFTIRQFDDGQKIDMTLPLKLVTETQRGRRRTYTLGGGSAQVDIESFDGSIHLRKAGELPKKGG